MSWRSSGSTTSVLATRSIRSTGESTAGSWKSNDTFCAFTSPAKASASARTAAASAAVTAPSVSGRSAARARRNGASDGISSSDTRASPRSSRLKRPSDSSSCSTITPAPATVANGGCPFASASPATSIVTAIARWPARQWRVIAR